MRKLVAAARMAEQQQEWQQQECASTLQGSMWALGAAYQGMRPSHSLVLAAVVASSARVLALELVLLAAPYLGRSGR